jgi:two-component system, cell cycle response regulator
MPKAKILLVEDSKGQAKTTKAFLEKNGFEVIWVEDGMAAFKLAKSSRVDVILLDRVLPDIDGNEVCRWLKLDQDTKSIPIIMLTIKNTTADKVTGLEAGADDYLPKPYDTGELNARIYACLRTKSLQDDLKQKNRQLEDMLTRVETLAVTDSLTGLFNRRRFETILSLEFKKASRYVAPLSCMMIDIDHFKLINDEYGHRTGDVILKETAQIILKSIREVDAAARWGGEEFSVLIPNTSKENAQTPAQRILRSVANNAFPEIGDRRITVSIGIADILDPLIDTEDKLVNAADLAMYEAKRKGRNRIEVSPEGTEPAREKKKAASRKG